MNSFVVDSEVLAAEEGATLSLQTLEFEIEYRTGSNNALDEFFRPALAQSAYYWRAVGFFSSTAFESFGEPLHDFVQRGGRIRLICSVELREDDIQAIEQGQSVAAVTEERIKEIIASEFSGEIGPGVRALCSLLEIGQLELRIAHTESHRGIFHEKVGIFFDADPSPESDRPEVYVAFSGSTNESRTAFEDNYECLDVYPSWSEQKRAKAKLKHFEVLWNGTAAGTKIYEFPDAAREMLIRVVTEASGSSQGRSQTAGGIVLWDHQTEAITEFLNARCGILEMATGTGKTRVALEILKTLIASGEIDSAIVTGFGTDLLDQWGGQLATELASETGYRLLRHYEGRHERDEFTLSPTHSVLLCSRAELASTLRRLPAPLLARLLVVFDEVHGLATETQIERLEGLLDGVRYKLGLSATPERAYDDAGNKFTEANVGPVIYEFPLEKAIEAGILCEFDYIPLCWTASDDDRRRLQGVYKRRAARQAEGSPMSDQELWTELARVYKTSKAKLPILEAYLNEHPEALQRCIIFLAEREYGESVFEMVHTIDHRFNTYFAEDDKEVLKAFARNELSCLITCHRISEGIDIRTVRSVILLASDRSKLETIQRIGRCLRRDPGDPNKRALVVDFVRTSGPDDPDTADEERQNWLEVVGATLGQP